MGNAMMKESEVGPCILLHNDHHLYLDIFVDITLQIKKENING